METKPTNPKDMAAVSKLPVHFVPPILQVYAAIGFAEGAYKYGAYNWRPGGARASIYYSALFRHMAKWWNGEDLDPSTGVPHLANAISCLGIIVDALEQGCLVDDRPPVQVGFTKRVDELANTITSLQEQFKHLTPYHHTAKGEQGFVGTVSQTSKMAEPVNGSCISSSGIPFNRKIFFHSTAYAKYEFYTIWEGKEKVLLHFLDKNRHLKFIITWTVYQWKDWLEEGHNNTEFSDLLDIHYGNR